MKPSRMQVRPGVGVVAVPARAGIDATDPELPVRVRCLQVLRMAELPAGETSLAPEVWRIVADRLRAMLR